MTHIIEWTYLKDFLLGHGFIVDGKPLAVQVLYKLPMVQFNGAINFFIILALSWLKFCICFNDIPLKMMNSAFYLILKALFVLMIFKFLSWLSGHVEK